MKAFALAGVLAVAGGLSFAAPAFAGYYDSYGVYHQTPLVKDYDRRDYNSMMTSTDIRVALESQGYDYVRGLRQIRYSDEWTAVAFKDGDWVRITIDGDNGRVLDEDPI